MKVDLYIVIIIGFVFMIGLKDFSKYGLGKILWNCWEGLGLEDVFYISLCFYCF